MNTEKSFPSFDEVVAFHGHSCIGLAIGYQVAIAAMNTLGTSRSEDEELVAVSETDACGVDAIQIVTGCTAGKGNLIIHDYGKYVTSFYSRSKQRAVRIISNVQTYTSKGDMAAVMETLRQKITAETATPQEEEQFHRIMEQMSVRIASARTEDVVLIQEIPYDPPQKARIFQSIICESCGEQVADAKTRIIDGKRVCIPCAERSTNS